MVLQSGIEVPEERVAEVCRKYKIKELAIFGSAARGDVGPDSDIDVMVELREDARLGWEFFGIAEELESLLGRRVDLGNKDGLRPHARPSALREALVVYAE